MINDAHLHIILVHIPVVLVPFACLTLLLGITRRNSTVTGVALSFLVVATLITVPAFLLGEGAEEIVEHLPGVSEHTIEEHEEAADVAFWCTVATGIVSLISLYGMKVAATWRTAAASLALLLSLGASICLTYAANQGGKIRHPEAYDSQGSQSQGAQNERDED